MRRDPSSADKDEPWPFDQGRNVAAITTANVIERGAPILVVIHYEDDHSWAFMCGTTNDDEDGRVIGMGTALQIDPTLREVADLLPGWKAWRSGIGEQWQRFPNRDE